MVKWEALLAVSLLSIAGVILYYPLPVAEPFAEEVSMYNCDTFAVSTTLGRIDLVKPLGHGSFSLVLLGIVAEQQLEVAVKIGMRSRANLSREREILSHESAHLPMLYGTCSISCAEGLSRPCLVLELLEPLVTRGLEDVLNIGMQTARALQHLHESTQYLMHDLHPGNLMMGRDRRVKLIDFGEAVRVGETIQPINPLYRSIYEELGLVISQRDDIERLVYVLVTLFHRRLPWQTSNGECDVRLKLGMTETEICEGFPPQIAEILFYARSCLPYGHVPDYTFISDQFRSALKSLSST